MLGRIAMAGLLLLALTLRGEPRPDQVARVAAGELTEARASWWGFDPDDATRFLQAAINSRVPKLIIDKMPTPWIATPLRGVSDQTLFFEPGSEIRAKPGCFMGTGDTLLTLQCVTNVTLSGYGAALRRRRDDYDKPPYVHAEWRHALSIRSCRNIKVYGLTLAESGGDGIYLGSMRDGWSNVDIHIKDVVCDRNYRQGISVISADGLLIEKTVMRWTKGTPPEAGIDFEPNRPGERLTRCVMRDCVTEGNQGDGYDFYLPNLHTDSAPLDIRLERCRSTGDRNSFVFTTGNCAPLGVTGSVTVVDSIFERPRQQGLLINGTSVVGPAMRFEGCTVQDVPAEQNYTDVAISARRQDSLPPGGVVFERLTVRQPAQRPWIALRNAGRTGGTVEAVTGDVTVRCGEGEERITLNEAWRQATFPPRFAVRIPKVTPNLQDAVIVDPEVGAMRKLQILKIRNRGRYLFFAEKGRTVNFLARQFQVGKYTLSKKPLRVMTLDGKELAKIPLPACDVTPLAISLPERGFYRLEVDVGANAFALAASDVPVAIEMDGFGQNFVYTTASFYFWVPPGTERFAVAVAGEPGEPVQASVFDPEGNRVWHRDPVGDWERYEALKGEGADGGLWRGQLARPSRGVQEDCSVELFGIPDLLFLSDERYWH